MTIGRKWSVPPVHDPDSSSAGGASCAAVSATGAGRQTEPPRAGRRHRHAGKLLARSVAAAALLACGGAQPAEAYIYWTDHGSLLPGAGAIGRADLDGAAGNASLITGLSFPFGIALDGAHIYWASNLSGTIGRANLDGGAATRSLITGASFPEGVAVDAAHVYWANSAASAGSIGRASLDGSGVDQSLITGASFPEGVAVDADHIYWANSAAASIGRANLDGSDVRQSFITGAATPWGLAVDGKHIYWANLGTGTIGRASLDGSAVDQSFVAGASSPTGVAVDAAHLYWANSATAAIARSNLDGTDVDQRLVPEAGTRPQGVAVNALPASAPPAPPAISRACVVPNLKGRTLAQAARLVARRGCRLLRVVGPPSPRHPLPARRVIGAQRPAPGTVVRKATPVHVHLTDAAHARGRR